jgi:uncharacterized protein YodC (DUF2158 family)
MAYVAGDVVILKSGGQPMTVVSADDDDIECVWLGEEGEFFRHTIPAIALQAAPQDEDEDEEEDDADEEEVAEDEGEDEPKKERAA